MKIKNILLKIISIIFGLIYWSLGLITLWSVSSNTFSDISRVLSGEYEITNLKWFLGMIPAIFLIFYIIFLLFKLSGLKTIVRLLAAATSLVFFFVIYFTQHQPPYLVMSLIFSTLTVFKLKNFQFNPKKDNTISNTYFKYFLISIFTLFLLLVVDNFFKFSPTKGSFAYLLSTIVSIIVLSFSGISFILSIFFRIKRLYQSRLLKVLTDQKIIKSFWKVSLCFIVSSILFYLVPYLLAYLTDTLESDIATNTLTKFFYLT